MKNGQLIDDDNKSSLHAKSLRIKYEILMMCICLSKG